MVELKEKFPTNERPSGCQVVAFSLLCAVGLRKPGASNSILHTKDKSKSRQANPPLFANSRCVGLATISESGGDACYYRGGGTYKKAERGSKHALLFEVVSNITFLIVGRESET